MMRLRYCRYSQQDTPDDGGTVVEGLQTNTTWDASGISLSFQLGDSLIQTAGTSLAIQDIHPHSYAPDIWSLNTSGPAVTVDGALIDGIDFMFIRWFSDAINDADLQVPVVSRWEGGTFSDRRLLLRSSGTTVLGANVTSITRVPEPGTLALLGIGALLFARRRR